MNYDIPKLLEKHWGIESILTIEKLPSIANRHNWRINSNFWLTCVHIDEKVMLNEEHRLMEELFLILIEQNAKITVPKIIPTLTSEKIIIQDEYVWRITQNIPDECFHAQDRIIYPLAINALDELHRAFGQLKPNWQFLHLGVAETLSQDLPRFLFEHSDPFIRSAAIHIEENIGILKNQPRVLTHGDFNPENIILRVNGHIKVVSGIVGFQMLRPDPAIFDYAQIFNNIICYSEVVDREYLFQETLHFLEYRYSLKEINFAMLAYWMELLIRNKRNAGFEKKIGHKMHQILDFAKITTG